MCARASRRERGIEGGSESRGSERIGGQEARERESRGDGERLVVVKALNHQLNEGYCGILW